jgi:hypothetical protein
LSDWPEGLKFGENTTAEIFEVKKEFDKYDHRLKKFEQYLSSTGTLASFGP